MTKDVKEICLAAIAAVNPYQTVRTHFQAQLASLRLVVPPSPSSQAEHHHHHNNDNQRYIQYDWSDYDQLVVIAFGKASSAMAKAVLDQLRHVTNVSELSNSQMRVDSSRQPQQEQQHDKKKICGVVTIKRGHATDEEIEFLQHHYSDIKIHEGGHPIPNDESMVAAQEIMNMVQSTASLRTLVICCISGGGSALCCLPHPSLTLEDLKRTNQVLLESGVGIHDINVLRKRLDLIKGGRLAMACYPSTIMTLVLSDVLGDPLDLIASGPTVPDTSNWHDAWNLITIRHPNLHERLPKAVVDLLKQHVDPVVPYQEDDTTSITPPSKPQFNQNDNDDDQSNQSMNIHPVFQNPKYQTVVVGNNEMAVQAAAHAAQNLGYRPIILGTRVEGEAQHVAHVYTAMAHYLSTHVRRSSSSSTAMNRTADRTHVSMTHNHGTGSDINSNPNISSSSFAMVDTFPAALIAGGETTVTLSSSASASGGTNNNDNKNGMGGRNQELALAAALQMQTLRLRNVVLASVGTDGNDGPTDAAGAVVDGTTVYRFDDSNQYNHAARLQDISRTTSHLKAREALSRHDSYTYLNQTDKDGESPLIKIGATGTNVADICVTLIK